MKYFLSLLLMFSSTAFAKPVLIASDIWCPYICEGHTGYVTELTRRALEEMDQQVHFLAVPFNRALKEVEQGNIDAILAITPTHVAQYKLFTDNLIIGYTSNDFYTTAESTWSFNQLNNIDTVQVGIIQGYDYGEKLNDKIAHSTDFYAATGNQPLLLNLERLVKGRFDVVLGNKVVIQYTAKQSGLMDKVKYAGSFGEPSPLYVGFSQGSIEVAKLYSQGIEKLKNSGEFQQILDKYQVENIDNVPPLSQ
ncbi:substrate-binding periplasmic protein [Shewanella donghaensis]|uniref:substrate-binding periplasmic protein n=1 Tax=Shewanella donghaensis TaxID=238836 RepID=UPI001182235C|nr:transporter substrate-binding domain-containing protein [Shewanella donghaensis]